jgi:hypothetical protein
VQEVLSTILYKISDEIQIGFRPTLCLMTLTAESAAYLGGIGTMLSQADVCTRCGKVHRVHYSPFRRSGSDGNCPDVVDGLFPSMAIEEFEPIFHEREFVAGAPPEGANAALPPPSSVPIPTVTKNGRLVIPWPMPAESEGYL